MEFDWDDLKNITNKQKHCIDLNDAKEVFKYQDSKIAADLRKNYKEDRLKIIGKIHASIISVIYTLRNNVTWIIWARKASSKEREEYNNK